MSVGWNGATPVSFADAASYDLGTKYHANADITISHVRIFGGDSGNMGGRTAHLFSAAGGSLAVVNLPNVVTPGWAVYALPAPVDINVGVDFWVAYDTTGSYGLVNPGGYPVPSADGLVTATGAAFTLTPGQFPNTSSNFFFGVDIQYTQRAGNVRPVAGLSVSAVGLTASAVVAITDESPSTCSVVVEWGDGSTSNQTGPGTVSHTYTASGMYAVMVTVTDAGGLTDSAAAPITVALPDTSLPFVVGIDAQRAATAMMIADDPSTIALIPRVESTSRTGGQFWDDGSARPAQTFKLIAMTYSQKPVVTVNGKERVVDYTLLGAWDCQMEIGDHWTGDDGRRYEIVAFAPGFGYERKGLVECHG